jgi:hypothetical protein
LSCVKTRLRKLDLMFAVSAPFNKGRDLGSEGAAKVRELIGYAWWNARFDMAQNMSVPFQAAQCQGHHPL